MREESIVSKEQLLKIADRIKTIRKENKLSQADFAERIGAVRETVGTWERAEKPIGFAFVMAICREFDCDADYLLGRIDEKTHDLAYLCHLTGLSEGAISTVIDWKKAKGRSELWVSYLSRMIEDNRIEDMMESFSDMISAAKCWRKSLDAQQRVDMEQEKNNYQSYQFQLAKVVTNIADSIAENEIRR